MMCFVCVYPAVFLYVCKLFYIMHGCRDNNTFLHTSLVSRTVFTCIVYQFYSSVFFLTILFFSVFTNILVQCFCQFFCSLFLPIFLFSVVLPIFFFSVLYQYFCFDVVYQFYSSVLTNILVLVLFTNNLVQCCLPIF